MISLKRNGLFKKKKKKTEKEKTHRVKVKRWKEDDVSDYQEKATFAWCKKNENFIFVLEHHDSFKQGLPKQKQSVGNFTFLLSPIWKWNCSVSYSRIDVSFVLFRFDRGFCDAEISFHFKNSQHRLRVFFWVVHHWPFHFCFSEFVSFLLEKQRFIFVQKKPLKRENQENLVSPPNRNPSAYLSSPPQNVVTFCNLWRPQRSSWKLIVLFCFW